ncbi:hypothetical protein EXIGLDRAFT_735291 [Exidia glandulosa HHB12029]|uniref:Glycan binding protein Y3-like domain-containing protein n=1 Tax=Exidia glandulosa HHB12029 TaxID=1314781 RepID=A0A165JVT1_EXIGL|nr:hypothetical protein EXIGLDRAFT_735291 [Exidia glandulosa HHB12029]
MRVLLISCVITLGLFVRGTRAGCFGGNGQVLDCSAHIDPFCTTQTTAFAAGDTLHACYGQEGHRCDLMTQNLGTANTSKFNDCVTAMNLMQIQCNGMGGTFQVGNFLYTYDPNSPTCALLD